MLKIAVVLFAFVPIASAKFFVADRFPHRQSMMPSNAMDRVNQFDALLMSEYRKNGVNGLAIYFDDSFTYRNFEGEVLDKREYLERLRSRKLDSIFRRGDYDKTAYFRAGKYGPHDLLVVSYYKEQVNYVLTLVEDNALRAGYRFLDIRPAAK